MAKTHDVLILGGGSAGYAAARTAHEQGARVGIVDHGPLGGLCILRGCMPTKTFLRSSDIMALAKRASTFGISTGAPRADLSAIIDRKNRLIQEFADDRIAALRNDRFTLYEERAAFLSPHEVQAGAHRITADTFIIATGSVVSSTEIPGLHAAGYLTSDDVLERRAQPRSMIVLGAGAVAVELAQFFARIGTEVTILQRSGHILSHQDEDLARAVEARFREEGIHLITGTTLRHVVDDGTAKTVHYQHNGTHGHVSGEVILQAMGRSPNIQSLNLSHAQVRVQDGAVAVDETMRTSMPHIFAVGDVNGLHEIVHIAIEQGEIAAWNATHPGESPRRYDDRLDMQVIFTDPQVASVGLSETACRKRNIPYLAASYPFNDHGKSLCLGETHGHVKLLCHPKTGEMLGGHIVGPEASELIHEVCTLMYYHGTVHDLLRIPHYHPTLAEILTYPAEDLQTQLHRSE